MSESILAKPITKSLSEAIESVMEGKHDFSTGDVTIHPKNKNDISDHDVNGNPIVRFSVAGGRKKSIQVPYSFSSNHTHGSASELTHDHPVTQLVLNHLKKSESYGDYDEHGKFDLDDGHRYNAGGAGDSDPTEADLKKQAKKNTLASKRDKLDRKAEKSLAPKETQESIVEGYSDKNPKIDLHHKETGAYIASTNFSPTVKHAVAGYEAKYPKMVGKVKGFKSNK